MRCLPSLHSPLCCASVRCKHTQHRSICLKCCENKQRKRNAGAQSSSCNTSRKRCSRADCRGRAPFAEGSGGFGGGVGGVGCERFASPATSPHCRLHPLPPLAPSHAPRPPPPLPPAHLRLSSAAAPPQPRPRCTLWASPLPSTLGSSVNSGNKKTRRPPGTSTAIASCNTGLRSQHNVRKKSERTHNSVRGSMDGQEWAESGHGATNGRQGSSRAAASMRSMRAIPLSMPPIHRRHHPLPAMWHGAQTILGGGADQDAALLLRRRMNGETGWRAGEGRQSKAAGELWGRNW